GFHVCLVKSLPAVVLMFWQDSLRRVPLSGLPSETTRATDCLVTSLGWQPMAVAMNCLMLPRAGSLSRVMTWEQALPGGRSGQVDSTTSHSTMNVPILRRLVIALQATTS